MELRGVKHAHCDYNMHDVKKITFILQDCNMCTNMHVKVTLDRHAIDMHVTCMLHACLAQHACICMYHACTRFRLGET